MSAPELQGRRSPQYLLYRAGAAIAGALPESIMFPGAAAAGKALAHLNRRRRAVVRRNMSRVVGPAALDAAVDRAFMSYARYWAETLRIPRPGADELRRRTTVEGIEAIERVRKYAESGRGVLFVSCHIGNWDLAGAWLAADGFELSSVAEEVSPPALYDLFVRLRRAVGVEVYPLGKAASVKAILQSLRRGGVVALIADRDITGSGVEVEFLGERTTLPAGPAVLAMRTGAVIAPGALFHAPGGRYHGLVLDPIPVEPARPDDAAVAELTQRIAASLEQIIRRDPGQWHMFQPNWPSDPGYGKQG